MKKYHVQHCYFIFIFLCLMFSQFLILFIYIINIRYWQVLFIIQEQLGKSQSATSTFECRGTTAAVLVCFVHIFFICLCSLFLISARTRCNCIYNSKSWCQSIFGKEFLTLLFYKEAPSLVTSFFQIWSYPPNFISLANRVIRPHLMC